MALHLAPRPEGRFLLVSEVIDRLKARFPWCEADSVSGPKDAQAFHTHLRHAHADEELCQRVLDAVPQALRITIADASIGTEALQLLLMPDLPLRVQNETLENELQIRPLIERSARTLEYIIC
ncbi:MAG: hypothetical protein ACK6D3_06070 [Planctomycetaceae bacterium]|jgi:hypothetical protein